MSTKRTPWLEKLQRKGGGQGSEEGEREVPRVWTRRVRVGFKNRKRKNWGQKKPRKDVLWFETRRLEVKDQS